MGATRAAAKTTQGVFLHLRSHLFWAVALRMEGPSRNSTEAWEAEAEEEEDRVSMETVASTAHSHRLRRSLRPPII